MQYFHQNFTYLKLVNKVSYIIKSKHLYPLRFDAYFLYSIVPVFILLFTHIFSVIFFTGKQHISSIHISHISIAHHITFHLFLPSFLHLFIFTPVNGIPFDVSRIADKLSHFQDSSMSLQI